MEPTLPVSNEQIETFSYPIGQLTISWTFFDRLVTTLVHLLKSDPKATHIKLRKGSGIDDRVRNLKKLLRTTQIEPEVITEVCSRLDNSRRYAKRRQCVCHWTISEYRDLPAPAMLFRKLNPDGSGTFKEESEWLSLDEIKNSANELNALCGVLHKICMFEIES